jgi:hypothetical protein
MSKTVTIQDELRQYLAETKTYYDSIEVYTNLFEPNVHIKLVFSWIEDDYQGSLFVIYEYTKDGKKYYLYSSAGFGSCSGCDYWESLNGSNIVEIKEALNELLNNMTVTHDSNTIELGEYTHPDLKLKLEVFKTC